MAGIMVRRTDGNRMYGFYRAQLHEKLADVVNFARQLFRCTGQRRVAQQMAIVFQHGAATGSVDDDRIDSIHLLAEYVGKGCTIRLSKLPGWNFLAGMIMDGAAAMLVAGHQHFATVVLQDADRGQVGFGENRVGDTSGKEGYTGSFLSLSGKNFLELPIMWFKRGQQLVHL